MADDTQRAIAESIGVPVARRHIFLCCDQTTPKCCDRDRSLAAWEYAGGRRGRGGASSTDGSLKVVTTHLRPGYLQKNGVPYSANAVLTEYVSRTAEPNGDSWLILTAIVEDPLYLNVPFIRSTHYKRLPDNFSGWEPEACSSR